MHTATARQAQAPTPTAQHQLLQLIHCLNANSTCIGSAVSVLQALARRVEQEIGIPEGGTTTAVSSTCAAQATGNTHLPPALRPHAVPRFHAPRTHQHIELHGITVADHTVALPGWDAAGLPRREVIWLALGLEGQALQAAQALELAEALRLIATAQIQRLQGQAQARQEGGAA